MVDIKIKNKTKLNRGVPIPMPEGPYSIRQVGGLDPSQASEPEAQVRVLLRWGQ
jgi:hypothetical protein